MSFKPFWIETNQVFGLVDSEEQYLKIIKRFKKAYPNKDILDLKIHQSNYDNENNKPKEINGVYSFGFRLAGVDYKLSDYFAS